MNNLNSILIEGNMVRDAVKKTTSNGTSVCNFTLASNRYFRKGDSYEKETCFVDIEAWGKLADSCVASGHKGRGVRVVGWLKQDRWTGVDGKFYSKLKISAEHIEYRPDYKKDQDLKSDNDSGKLPMEVEDVPVEDMPIEEEGV